MVKSGKYEVKQPNIFGRIGTGIGKGLAEQLPKEMERGRLAAGLKQFEKDVGNLNPLQQLTRLASIPGAVENPQLIQSFSQLARQQAQANALKNNEPISPQQQTSPFPQQTQKSISGSEIPSITQEKPLEKIQEGYIPPTQDQIFEDAGRRFNANPALFNNDPQLAIQAAENAALRDQSRNEAFQKKHENLTRIQDNVVTRLRNHAEQLKVKIPANVYSKIEDEAIQATKPKSQGGSGLTEQQAMKETGKKLDDISRDYQEIESIGSWGITGRKAEKTLSSFKALQKKFEERNDTQNFADRMIAVNQLSPMTAYSIAEPVSRTPKLNQVIASAPRLNETKFTPTSMGLGVSGPNAKEVYDKSLELSKKLAPLLGDKGSPLAVAYELQKKGYNSDAWLDYLIDHSDELNLSKKQLNQLEKPRNSIGTWNDWWLSAWSGLDKESEKK